MWAIRVVRGTMKGDAPAGGTRSILALVRLKGVPLYLELQVREPLHGSRVGYRCYFVILITCITLALQSNELQSADLSGK